jgi:hypothetical protein
MGSVRLAGVVGALVPDAGRGGKDSIQFALRGGKAGPNEPVLSFSLTQLRNSRSW